MKKLYSIKEITQMLNDELAASNVDYRYTEERVRARLRYLRSRATHEAEALHVEPKVYGYDRRAKYYTEEDVAKLKAVWVGPMLPEFTEVLEDISEGEEQDEVEVREAKAGDVVGIRDLLPVESIEVSDWQTHIGRMLKEAKGKVFVAFIPDGKIVGWSQAEISSSFSLIEGALAGIIRAFAESSRADAQRIIRLLVYRGQWWLKQQNIQRMVVELPAALASESLDTYLEAEGDILIFTFSNPE